MMQGWSWLCAALALAPLASACSERAHASSEPRSGGAATVFDATRDAFSLPVPELTEVQRAQFFVGNSFFNQNWVAAPASVPERDGLGPLFNARSCSGCHFKDGRGRPPEPGEPFVSMLLRIGVPGLDEHGAPRGHEVYGDQLQGSALPALASEGDARVSYSPVERRFADGESYQLLAPSYRIDNPGYGPLPSDLRISPRVAPMMAGLGLLEAVPEATLRTLSDEQDRDGDGISGRLNMVWDQAAQRQAPGRMGWKAEQPSVRQQIAGAFLGDMGLSSELFAGDNHSPSQTAAQAFPDGGKPEVNPRTLESITVYARALAVPARRDVQNEQVLRGEHLFAEAKCTACHVSNLRTGKVQDLAALSDQLIHPYTDMLLHDMGEALSDARPSFLAEGSEWRTPPLWGIGLVRKVNGHTRFLHDGRARDLREAVLWHGGEANASRSAFERMPREDRAALITFLESL
ncbi:MAG: di-heme oxidoredictase family protein [Myxococcales bacterium]